LPEKEWKESIEIGKIVKIFADLEFRNLGQRLTQALSGKSVTSTKENGAKVGDKVGTKNEAMAIYATAWEKGLKSTYYLHLKPRHTAEQSTIRVNKAEKMGKIGFAAVAKAKTEEQSPIEKETEVAFSMPKQSSMPVVTILPKVSNVNSPLNTSQYTGAPIINNINTVNQVKTVSHAEPVISKYVEPTISNIMSEVQPKATAIFGFGAIKKQNDNENAIETSVVISNHSTEVQPQTLGQSPGQILILGQIFE
jgi:hypothetical protein